MNIQEVLNSLYEDAMQKASGKKTISTTLQKKICNYIDIILSFSEQNKAVYTVVFTSMVYKYLHPEQDIRKHQSSIEGGYSGRTFDGNYITPFLKECEFPAMAESGWLTRSLEQKVPYDRNYTGAIKEPLKKCFIELLFEVEENGISAKDVIDYMLQGLIIQRDAKRTSLAKPQNLSINEIISLLDNHFHSKYKSHGASRLPVLALYAIYQCLIKECRRFDGKILLPIESHTSADIQSGRMGDIDVVNEISNTPFEAVEVKFDIPISYDIVDIAKKKIEKSKISRYYILSTKEVVDSDKERIDKIIRQLKNIHGCQLVVNGVKPSLKYYLRLIDDTKSFIDHYTDLLSSDKAIMFEHKQAWNNLVSNM